ncbi:hypothetical protein ACFQYP_20490 [Nonomuraea antimicrobica]
MTFLPSTTCDGVTWNWPTPGLGTATFTCCQADQVEEAAPTSERSRQRTSQPSVSLPSGTGTATAVPDATLSSAVAQIWPLPCPCGAAGSCSSSTSTREAVPCGWDTSARSSGVTDVATVAPSWVCEGTTWSRLTAGSVAGSKMSVRNRCQADQVGVEPGVLALTRNS